MSNCRTAKPNLALLGNRETLVPVEEAPEVPVELRVVRFISPMFVPSSSKRFGFALSIMIGVC